MANLQIRIDDALKSQAQAITADLGMDVATAVRIFLAQMVREKALPFTPSLDRLAQEMDASTNSTYRQLIEDAHEAPMA